MKNSKTTLTSVLLLICLTAATILFQTACGGDPPRHLVVVIDLSDGIETPARNDVLTRIVEAFKNKKIHRGDLLTVIPITGDAKTEGQGRVLNFKVRAESDREVYDADLKKLAHDVEARLGQMQSLGETTPYNRSDIIGAVQMAGEVFAQQNSKDQKRILLILSDLIQHNAVSRFETESQLNSPDAVCSYAAKMAVSNAGAFNDVQIQIGLLRSNDLKAVALHRREMIEKFWKEYLSNCGAKSVSVFTDGTAQIRNLLYE